MFENKTCRTCAIAWIALILVVAGLFAMPFVPSLADEEPQVVPQLPPGGTVHATLVDPADIGSLDRAEMQYPED